MRKLLVVALCFSICSASAFAELTVKRKYYTSTGIEVEDVYIPNTTFLRYRGKSEYDPEHQGCSAVANLYSTLGLDVSLDAVKNVFENWKQLALPVLIYALATQFPYVKESLVSSQFISDFLGQLGGASCESVFSFINQVNGVSKEKIAECMNKHRECDSNPDPNKCYLEKCGVHKSWYELVSGKKFREILHDSSALKKISEALAMINPKTTISCMMGLSDVPERMNAEEFEQNVKMIEEKTGFGEVESRTLLILLSTIPQVSIESNGMGLKIPKIDGKTMTLMRGFNMLTDDMLDDLDKLISDIENSSPEQIRERVEEFEEKYGIKFTSDFYFVAVKYTRKKLEEDCSNTLGGTPTEEEFNAFCPDRIEALKEAERKFAEIASLKYALAVKEAMLRYIDQTKLYLLQQKDSGLAVCSKLQDKKLDLSEDNVKLMVKQLDVLSERVKSEVDSYLASKGVTVKDIDKLSLEVSKLLAKAVDGKEHKEGEWVEFTVEE